MNTQQETTPALSYEKDKNGNPYLGLSTIYTFYGVKKKDYFSFWVQNGIVVKAPPRHSIHKHESIEDVIKFLTKARYRYEVS